MKKITKILMSLALAFGLGLVLNSSAYAADPALDSITISPVSAKLQLAPGTTTDGTFKVTNSGTSELVFKVYATPFYVNHNDYADLQFSGETNRTQISRWISFDQTEYTLASGAVAQIAYHVNVPASVPAGGQYAAIMAESVPTVAGEGIAASSRVGMLVFSSIAGTTIEKGEILGNNINGWYKVSPVETSISVKNDGNTDFTVDTTMKVYNVFGAEVYNSGVKNNQVLPETSRSIPLDWESGMRVGFYIVKQNVQFLGYDETYTRVVLLMPIWLLLIILILAIVVIALVVIKLQNSTSQKKPATKRAPAKKPAAKRSRK
jgi:hypothetical protein